MHKLENNSLKKHNSTNYDKNKSFKNNIKNKYKKYNMMYS